MLIELDGHLDLESSVDGWPTEIAYLCLLWLQAWAQSKLMALHSGLLVKRDETLAWSVFVMTVSPTRERQSPFSTDFDVRSSGAFSRLGLSRFRVSLTLAEDCAKGEDG